MPTFDHADREWDSEEREYLMFAARISISLSCVVDTALPIDFLRKVADYGYPDETFL